jgi:hypothetical protein
MSSTALSVCIVFRCLRHPGVPRTQDPVFYPVARRCRKGLPSMLRCLGGMFSAFQVTPNDEQGSESSRYCCSRSSARTSEDLSMYPFPDHLLAASVPLPERSEYSPILVRTLCAGYYVFVLSRRLRHQTAKMQQRTRTTTVRRAASPSPRTAPIRVKLRAWPLSSLPCAMAG